MAKNRPTTPGSDDDCYNRVTRECNKKHPDKNWGDKEYRDCINDGLDACDRDEPNAAVILPTFDDSGRLVVPGRVEAAFNGLMRAVLHRS